MSQHCTIRVFLRIVSYDGLLNEEMSAAQDYQFLDKNTVMHRHHPPSSDYTMHKFSMVFGPKDTLATVALQIGEIEQLFEGYNTMLIIAADLPAKQLTTFGVPDNPGLLIETMRLILKQAQCSYRKQVPIISVTIFSTMRKRNVMIDLLNGQTFTFRTKSEIDGDKMFMAVAVHDLRGFLVLLKIAQLRHQACCDHTDSLVVKVNVQCQQQDQQVLLFGNLHFIIIDPQDKGYEQLTRMITCESETTNPLGSLKHYLDPYMHNTQIIILHNVMNQPEDILKTMPLFSSVCKLRGKALSRSQFIAPVDHKYHRQDPFVNMKYPTEQFNLSLLDNKQLTLLRTLLTDYHSFCKQARDHLHKYLYQLQEIIKIRKQFLGRECFTVALEIREGSIKSFFNAKLYTLCENFQMINTEPLFERVRVLKNRVLISLRALVNRRKIDREKSNELQIFEERFDTALRFVRGKIGHIFTLSMRTHQQVGQETLRKQSEQALNSRWISQCHKRISTYRMTYHQQKDLVLRELHFFNRSQRHSTIKSQKENKYHKNISSQKHSYNHKDQETFDCKLKQSKSGTMHDENIQQPQPKKVSFLPQIVLIHRR